MRAVNLIPSDSRRGTLGRPTGTLTLTHAVVLVLAVGVAFATIYTLTSNTVSSRKAKLASLQAEVVQERALAARLQNYVSFEKLAQARVQTVRQIAAARFDWHGALADLAKVVPANTSLTQLTGTVVPSASVSGSGGAGASSVRGDLTAPAFELDGCTKNQDDVARLMSRLRLMNGVTRVTLNDSEKSTSGSGAATVSNSSSSGSGGCTSNEPSFDLVVFFTPVANAGPTGIAAATPVSTTTGATP